MNIDTLFAINTSPIELVVRGSLTYWFLLLVFRFVLRRDPGALGVADLLFVVIVADASQNAMAGGYGTVAEGLVLVGTLAAWNFAIDWGAYHFKVVRWLTEPEPLMLVDNGRIVIANMRKQFLTREDIEAELRLAGIEDITRVRKAYMESDGKLSVLPFEPHEHRAPKSGSAGVD